MGTGTDLQRYAPVRCFWIRPGQQEALLGKEQSAAAFLVATRLYADHREAGLLYPARCDGSNVLAAGGPQCHPQIATRRVGVLPLLYVPPAAIPESVGTEVGL